MHHIQVHQKTEQQGRVKRYEILIFIEQQQKKNEHGVLTHFWHIHPQDICSDYTYP